MSTMEIKDLSIKYNYGTLAISHLNMRADIGEIYTVLGTAESGKTTLLKCIAGLIKPIEGKILLDEVDITKAKVKDRDVCLVYEDGCFFENRKVVYNLLYPLKVRKVKSDERMDIVKRVLQTYEIEESFLQKKVKKLSSEERFLLSILRAEIRDAKIFLIDDPLKNISVDREKYFSVLHHFMQKKAEKGIVVYATSQGKDCIKIGNYCAVLNYGITLQNGIIDDIIAFPRSIGTIKMLLPDVEIITGKIEFSEQLFLISGKNRIILNKKRLLSNIFVGKECFFVKTDKLLIFDKRSERIIYFD